MMTNKLIKPMPAFNDVMEKSPYDFEWEPMQYAHTAVKSPDICRASYSGGSRKQKPQLKLSFGKTIYDHLGLDGQAKIHLLQAKGNIYNYLLVKSPAGIRFYKPNTKVETYYFSKRFARDGLVEFNRTDLAFELYSNGTVRIIFPQQIIT